MSGVDPDAWGLELGHKGSLRGTEIEVLGWARWRTHDGYTYWDITTRTSDAERWSIEVDQGHALLLRHLDPDPAWTDPLGHLDGDRIELMGRRWVWPQNRARLEHVRGEYWKDLEKGDREIGRSFYKAPTVISASREVQDSEWEWSQGIYLDRAEAEEALGCSLPPATEPHPARPIPYRSWTRLFKRLAFVCGLAGLIVALAVDSPGGTKLFTEQVPASTSTGETFVGLMDVDRPVVAGLQVRAPHLHQTWAFVEASITTVPPADADPEDFEPTVLGKLASELSYYEGYDSDGKWTEGALQSAEGFQLAPGSYMVHLGWEIDPRQSLPLQIRVEVLEGYRDTTLLIFWSIVLLVIALILWLVHKAAWHAVLVEAGLREEEDD